MNARLAAVRALSLVLDQGHSLTNALDEVLPPINKPADRALIQAMSYGVLRWYPRLLALTRQLMRKPLKARDNDVQWLLLVGLYQLIYMRIPDHAAVSETVAATRAMQKPWARALVNGVLRNYQRQAEALQQQVDQSPSSRYAHPDWLLNLLQRCWPDDWQTIVTANNQQAPMTLRINNRQCERDAYLIELSRRGLNATLTPFTTTGITLENPAPVEALPGFSNGDISVQDGAAQLAAQLLDAQPGERILDACAAPGGKTAHILESQPDLQTLVALDIDAQRLDRIAENLSRLHLQATLITGDASQAESWWDQHPFDRILLDAPCSATGVIRRHPDIKVLRRADDIAKLVTTQQNMLRALWPLLKPDGMLLYATCSVLPQENTQQLEQFLATTNDAVLLPIDAAWGHEMPVGKQILPGENGMDGFYYACLHKTQ